jgi:hypothetical protein
LGPAIRATVVRCCFPYTRFATRALSRPPCPATAGPSRQVFVPNFHIAVSEREASRLIFVFVLIPLLASLHRYTRSPLPSSLPAFSLPNLVAAPWAGHVQLRPQRFPLPVRASSAAFLESGKSFPCASIDWPSHTMKNETKEVVTR